jgi:hypothetical protein
LSIWSLGFGQTTGGFIVNCKIRTKLISLNIYAYNTLHIRVYSNEGLEPIHVHAEKGDMECKFWLLIEEVEIREEFSFNLNPASKKEIKKIIYQHFDLIVDAWNKHFKK